jgi:hypothetical protein
MRPFTHSKFYKHNCEIPNLHPDFKMEIEQGFNSYGTEVTLKNYYVKGSAMTLTRDMAIINDEWYHIFSVSNNGWVRDYNSTVASAAGLVKIRNSWDGENAAVDAMYYKSNPVNLFLKNGTLRKGIYKEVARRLDSERWCKSGYTHELLQTCIDTQPDVITEDADAIVAHMSGVYNIELFKCHLTHKVFPYYMGRAYEFSCGIRQVYNNFSPSDCGYTRHERGHGYVYLLDDECIIQGRIYKRSEVTMCECPVCHREVPDLSIIDGACHKCNENLYKIHNYSTKVPELLKFKAKNVKPSTVYLGIELEYESDDRDVSKIKVGKALQGHAIMKQDGSIKNGFEIVTCPATLDIHLEEFKKFYSSYGSLGLFPDKNTGMHVHVSRKPLNVFTIGKMTEFLNRIDNKAFIAHIAGRIDNQYARITGRSVTFPFINGQQGERYNALNLSNRDTIEFRIFSTPKNWEEFSARLEFVQALTDYCQPAQVNVPLKQLTGHRSFMHWVLHNRKSYPELSNCLKGFA